MDITVSGTLNIFADVTTINQIAGLIGGGMDCENMKFVVTGKLKYYENRGELVEEIEDMGGSVTGSVSKNTDYLICNDKDSTSSKMKKAQELHPLPLPALHDSFKFPNTLILRQQQYL